MTNKPLRLEWWSPADLRENPRNCRGHPGSQLRALRAAIAELGWAGALLYNERTGRLIDGHARKRVALKGEKVPVLVGLWSEEDEAKLLASFDSIGAMAQVDRTALERLLKSVTFESSAITSLLESFAGEGALNCLIDPAELNEPPDQFECADELLAKWRPKPREIWQAGQQRVGWGDATDEGLVDCLLADVPPVSLLVADPPYGVNYESKTAWMEKHGAHRKRAAIQNDTLKPESIRRLFGGALKVASKHAAAGAAVYATVPSGALLPHFIAGLEDGGFTFKHALVWVKNSMVLGRGDYHYRHESILYGWIQNGPHYFLADRSKTSVFEIERPHASPFHATTKPLALFAQFILNSSRKSEVVFDPFCGSGTTLLACEQLGRVGCGVDLNPSCVAVTLERLSMLGLKPKLIGTVED